MASQLRARGKILVGVGANYPGPWGTSSEAIAQALSEIERAHVRVEAVSPFYETEAVGNARQPAYVNAVALLDTPLSPEALLRVLKGIERRSGRRGGRPWGPRTLDIDIIDYDGLVRHWRGQKSDFRRAGPRPLVLPHPLAHERPFVLQPLIDVAPKWRHPVLQKSAAELLHAMPKASRGRVLKRL
ncbi:MAG: 2-amino-4-hydroxy-6-hydroxymethyldihydropteridine diphosphokinase [Methyloceanibacter sp.]